MSRAVPLLAALLLAGTAPAGCGDGGAPGGGSAGGDVGADARARRDVAAGDPDSDEPPDAAGDMTTEAGDAGAGDGSGAPACTAGAVICQTETLSLVCDESGALQPVACAEGFRCVEPDGCLEVICDANQGVACVDSGTTQVCDATGTAVEDHPCTGGRTCDDGDPGSCVARECGPNDGQCLEDGTRLVCDADGLWQPQPPCVPDDLGTQCDEGQCRTLCQIARRTQSYVGCEYWAADLGNYFAEPDDRNFDLGFVVTNTHDTLPSTVTLSTEAGDVASQVVAPQSVATFVVPGPRPRNNQGTGLRRTAYRLRSTIPVAAYQFNPLQTVVTSGDTVVRRAASTDASMLIPDPVLDDRFRVLAWPQTPAPGGVSSGGSLLAVVAGQEATQVTLVATATSAVGTGVEAPVVPNVERVFDLEPFDVLQLTTLAPGQDWTGTTIESSAPVAVFTGNECARVPAGTNYCDHLEESLFGLTAWGTTYVAAKTWPRGAEADQYRILASQDGTAVTLGPPLDQSRTLSAGEHWDVATDESFVVTADKPILVAQLLEGSGAVVPGCDPGYDCSEVGDPSLLLLPPVEQFRTQYAFLTPDTYQQDFATLLLGDVGQAVELDGQPLSATAATVGDGPWAFARVRLDDGPHRLESDAPFGVLVYGYGGNDDDILDDGAANVSYAYPGGLNFLPINPKGPLPDEGDPGH